jgi:hypothetical protein
VKLEGEREFELKKLWFKGFSSQWSGQRRGGGVETPFYRPHRESICLGVRDPDMFGLGPDMTGKNLWTSVLAPDLSGVGT